MTEPPVLVMHLYTDKARAEILKRLKAKRRPPGTMVFLGRYGINPGDAANIAAAGIPDVHYAPTLHLSLKDTADLRAKRRLPPADAKKVAPALSGRFPAIPQKLLPASNPRAWGVELGRRFRDQLRQAERAHGHEITAWQLDEIPPACGESKVSRLFVGGVIIGIAQGRPKLGDKVMPGFVWIAAKALQTLPGLSPAVADVKIFWDDVNAGARCLVGEEYPRFEGNAPAAGELNARPQKALGAPGSPARQALAKRYVVGMTPGFHEPFSRGLAGNVHHMPLPKVKAWRNSFITARAKAQRPVGYGMFHFDGNFNTVPAHIDNAVTALCFAANQHAKP
jgi:hypothetical protein